MTPSNTSGDINEISDEIHSEDDNHDDGEDWMFIAVH